MTKKIGFLSCLLLFLGNVQLLFGQNYWHTLSEVSYKSRYDAQIGFALDYPVFSQQIKQLEGKQITLKGYQVPLKELMGKQHFVLSSLPFSECFFCGAAGPETVIEIKLIGTFVQTEALISVRGTLKLNDSQPGALMYCLENAKILE